MGGGYLVHRETGEEINLYSRGEDRRSGRDGKTIQGHFDLELPKISQGELEKVRG